MSAELIRLLENVLRVGVVIAVDEESWRVRVQSGELQTDWLRWNTTRAGAFSIWVPPSVGEQVWLGCIGGNPFHCLFQHPRRYVAHGNLSIPKLHHLPLRFARDFRQFNLLTGIKKNLLAQSGIGR